MQTPLRRPLLGPWRSGSAPRASAPRAGASPGRHDDALAAGLRRGILGAVLCGLGLASLWAVSVPAYWAVDELSHIAYARTVATGRLPLIDTPIGDLGVLGLDERLEFERGARNTDRMDVWTANHPPLHYALASLPLAAGAAAGASHLGLLGARAVAVLAVAAGVALTALLVRVLAPDRPRLAVLAAALAALTPSLDHFGGQVFNDALSFALCTLVAVTAVIALRDGPGRWRCMAVGAAGAAAALTRVSALPLLALAAVACALGAWRAAGPSARVAARAWAALRAGAVASAVPAVGAGWFYARNLVHYGDLTGSEALLDKFERDPNTPFGRLLVDGGFYVNQWERLIGDLATGVWTEGWRLRAIHAVGLLLLAGVAVATGRWLRAAARGHGRGRARVAGSARDRRRAGAGRRDGDPVLGAGGAIGFWERRWAWLLLVAFPAGLLVATARFHAEGGSAHARYLLSALAVLALLWACALDELGRRQAAWPLLLGVGGFAVVAVGAWVDFLRFWRDEWVLDDRIFLYPTALDETGTAVASGIALAVVAVGAVLVLRSLRSLPAAVPDPAAGPAARDAHRAAAD